MNNEDIIKTLMQLEYPYPTCEEQEKVNEALNKAIEALYSFEHVIVKYPSYDDREFDGWIDRKRCLLFIDSITFEGARLSGWEWRTEKEINKND